MKLCNKTLVEVGHDTYMQRCIELSKHGLRKAMPNPSVGAILVYNGRIIGEGSTSPYGGPHAEVNCINSVRAEDHHYIPDSTLYVSLEPCSHHGKTPPCCDLIIKNKIKKIVVGTVDPNVQVAGKGIAILKNTGKEVNVGILEKECRESNRRFFTYHEKQKPYIILKWAESADGFLGPLRSLKGCALPEQDNKTMRKKIDEKKPVWITNPYSRQLVHKWRSEEMAILAGTQTVLDDNPSLDVRDWHGQSPVRIILDKTGKISNDYSVKNQKIKTIVLTEESNLSNLENLAYETIVFDNALAERICRVLYRHGLQSVIVEGGCKTLQTFIETGLWDEARIFKGTIIFKEGTKAPVLPQIKPLLKQNILDDELLIFRKHG